MAIFTVRYDPKRKHDLGFAILQSCNKSSGYVRLGAKLSPDCVVIEYQSGYIPDGITLSKLREIIGIPDTKPSKPDDHSTGILPNRCRHISQARKGYLFD